MTRKIIVTNSHYAPLVNNGDVMTVVGEHGHGPVDATLDGGDGFVWYIQPGEFEEYVPQEEPKLWRDMTDAEKGALLLAHHEGKDIEAWLYGDKWKVSPPEWDQHNAYRTKPEPKRETVALYGSKGALWIFGPRISGAYDTHRITFNLIDGEPDTASIKMETITNDQ